MKIVVLGGNALEYFSKEQEAYILRTPPVETEGLSQDGRSISFPEFRLIQSGGTEKKVRADLSGQEQPFETKFLIHEDTQQIELTSVISTRPAPVLDYWPSGAFPALMSWDVHFEVFGMNHAGDFFVLVEWDMMKRVRTKIIGLEAQILQ